MQKDLCPPPETVQSNGFSSCQISSHCPGNASCCPDSGGARQCLVNYNTTLSVDAQLESVCAAVPLDLAKLAGSDCSQDPAVCSMGSVCCDGLCHGLPTQNETLFDSCIPGTLSVAMLCISCTKLMYSQPVQCYWRVPGCCGVVLWCCVWTRYGDVPGIRASLCQAGPV